MTLCLIAAAPCAAGAQVPTTSARWLVVAVSHDPRATYSVDTLTITREQDRIVHAWIKEEPDTLTLDKVSGDLYAYELTEYRFDCEGRRLMGLSITRYSARHEPVGSATDFEHPKWYGAVPESVGELLLSHSCAFLANRNR